METYVVYAFIAADVAAFDVSDVIVFVIFNEVEVSVVVCYG